MGLVCSRRAPVGDLSRRSAPSRPSVSIRGRRLRIVSEMIAYCGLDCSKCDAFIATREEDSERKKEMAQRWTKSLNIEFGPGDIDCTGCMSEKISGWCTKVCKMRPCAETRKVKTCAHCEDYPCEKLQKFLSDEPKAAKTLDEIHRTLTVQRGWATT
jgi:hypothetical protein